MMPPPGLLEIMCLAMYYGLALFVITILMLLAFLDENYD